MPVEPIAVCVGILICWIFVPGPQQKEQPKPKPEQPKPKPRANFCSHCSARLPANASYCPGCGKPLN